MSNTTPSEASMVLAAAMRLPPPPKGPGIANVCPCGIAHTWLDWLMLERVGVQEDGDGGGAMLRNCLCGSTRAVDVIAEEAARSALFLNGEAVASMRAEARALVRSARNVARVA